MSCGIYKITNLITGKSYVGKSKNIELRIEQHFAQMDQKTNSRILFDKVKAMYTKNDFEWEIIEECHPDQLNINEQFYIQELETLYPKGYNTAPGGEGGDTYTNSPLRDEYCKKVSEARNNFYGSMTAEERSSFHHGFPNPALGKCWFNDGTSEGLFFPDEVPEGWTKGRIKKSIKGLEKGQCSKKSAKYNPRLPLVAEAIDVSDLEIEVLDNGNWTPIKTIIKNTKNISEKFCIIEYRLPNGSTRVFQCTVDHPLVINNLERVKAQDLEQGDYLNGVDGKKYEILSIRPYLHNKDSYDLETDSDTFDCSGIRSHNCRTLTISDALAKYDSYTNAEKDYKYERKSLPPYGYTLGRGNFNFVTLNLPRYAIEAVNKVKGKQYFSKRTDEEQKTILEHFYRLIIKYILYAKNILIMRQAIIGNKPKVNFSFHLGQDLVRGSEKITDTDTTHEIWDHFSKSIGYIGLYETMMLLYNKDQIELPDEAFKIVEFIRKYTDAMTSGYYILPTKQEVKNLEWYKDIFNVEQSEFSKWTPIKSDWDLQFQIYDLYSNEPVYLKNKPKLKKNNWSTFGTPAEGACMAFRNADFRKFGKIKNVTDKDYYTNSNHVDVRKEITMKDKINTEAKYHTLANAGNIFYIETDGLISKNLSAYEEILQYMHDKELGYSAVNIPLDMCVICKYRGEIKKGEGCPVCGNKDEDEIVRIRRVTGYLTPPKKVINRKTGKTAHVQGVNAGKKAEIKSRVKHN